MRSVLTVLVGLVAATSCARSQSVDSLRVYPPYSDKEIKLIAEVAESGSEVYILLPVSTDEKGQGYIITTTRGLIANADASVSDLKGYVIDSLASLPLGQEVNIPDYDFGVIQEDQLARFKAKTTCELVERYFDEEGLAIALGPLGPGAFVVAELLSRGAHIYPHRDAAYSLDPVRYCRK